MLENSTMDDNHDYLTVYSKVKGFPRMVRTSWNFIGVYGHPSSRKTSDLEESNLRKYWVCFLGDIIEFVCRGSSEFYSYSCFPKYECSRR